MTALREERKVLTALFVDVVGSTALGERLDPEDVKLVVGDVRITINTDKERMTVRVLGKSGTLPLINSIGGDGVPEIAGTAPKLIGKKKPKG